jgi:hypothetical protein
MGWGGGMGMGGMSMGGMGMGMRPFGVPAVGGYRYGFGGGPMGFGGVYGAGFYRGW